MVNYNPETVSTDYDECDRLYFDEISYEVSSHTRLPSVHHRKCSSSAFIEHNNKHNTNSLSTSCNLLHTVYMGVVGGLLTVLAAKDKRCTS